MGLIKENVNYRLTAGSSKKAIRPTVNQFVRKDWVAVGPKRWQETEKGEKSKSLS